MSNAVTDEMLEQFALVARWDDMADALIARADRRFDSDHGSLRMRLVVIGLLLVGGSGLRHVAVMARDPLFAPAAESWQ